MTPEKHCQAITVGMEQVREFKERGCRLIGTGEMGWKYHQQCRGDSVTSEDVKKMTGRGAGG